MRRERFRNRALARSVPPADRVRSHIDEPFGHDRQLPEILADLVRLGAQLSMEAAPSAAGVDAPLDTSPNAGALRWLRGGAGAVR